MSERKSMATKENSEDMGTADLINPRQRYRLSTITRSPPLKTTIAAVSLLFVGFCMLVTGLSLYFATKVQKDRGMSVIILGALMFIPGSYATIIIFGTWRGWRGYRYDAIANYDEI